MIFYSFLSIASVKAFPHESKHETNDAHDGNYRADKPIQDPDTPQIELLTHFIDKISDAEPPGEGSQGYSQITRYSLKDQYTFAYKGETGKESDKKEDDERIAEGHGKSRYEIVYIATFVGRYGTQTLDGIGSESINSKAEQHDTADQLEPKDVFVDVVKYKTHPITRQKGIADVTQGGANAGDEAIPTAFVQGSLNTKYPHRAQWSGYNYTYYKALPKYVEYSSYLNHAANIVFFYETSIVS